MELGRGGVEGRWGRSGMEILEEVGVWGVEE
jgi:hypothetical protein